jgi:hypothetical protein
MVATDIEANEETHPNLMSTEDFHKKDRWYDRINTYIAVKITAAVGTMWCAYVFAIFDCLALPQAIHQGLFGVVQWVASFFLQLVLLSIIMVKQNIDSTASDARAMQTYNDTEFIKANQDYVLIMLKEIRQKVGVSE